jgi:hypothetical protein
LSHTKFLFFHRANFAVGQYSNCHLTAHNQLRRQASAKIWRCSSGDAHFCKIYKRKITFTWRKEVGRNLHCYYNQKGCASKGYKKRAKHALYANWI